LRRIFLGKKVETQHIPLKLAQAPYDEEDVKFWKEMKGYWQERGQPWRLMPEIDEERQMFLAERRSITPNNQQGIYPFKGIKLYRADIEWLLATHENGRGPIDWSDESQGGRYGLDVRGADLRNANLADLPLSCMGKVESEIEELFGMTMLNERPDAATIHLEGANLASAHLEGADLRKANLEKAFIIEANVEQVHFADANLKGAVFWKSNLKNAFFWNSHLEKAVLEDAHLEGAVIKYSHLGGANIQGAFFDNLTRLNGSSLSDTKYGAVALSDVRWGDVNLAVVNWSAISVLGDEVEARTTKKDEDRDKVKYERFLDYQTAARAYRQLSVVLRNQGLNEDAARFTYRAQIMQRKVFWYEHKFVKYLGSLFLDLLSGYGYKIGRCFIAYALVIGLFATIYHILGTHPTWNESLVISKTAFHGRGFFPEQFHPGDPQALAAAIEAFVGLLIEITLIATLTQRLFGK
jgi:uncharacterized protein YjbI with pentapeptide repeats